MNRKQRRAFANGIHKNGVDLRSAKSYAEIISNGTGEHTAAQDILEGEKIKLNIKEIKNRKNYDIMNPKYKEFVDSSEDVVFTAHIEHGGLVSLEEEPQWLFWSGDLIRVKTEG